FLLPPKHNAKANRLRRHSELQQLLPQLRHIFHANSVHAQSPRGLQVEIAIVNKTKILRPHLCEGERELINTFLRFTHSHVAGTHEQAEYLAEIKSLDPVLV